MSATALVRPPGDSLASGATLTFLAARPIDSERASAQHAQYVAALAAGGYDVIELPPLPGHPDAAFVEDLGFGLPEAWILGRSANPARAGELAETDRAFDFEATGDVVRIVAPGTLDGGDVLVMGSTIHVGLSRRTNAEAARQVGKAAGEWGYSVRTIPVRAALHLKTACTAVDPQTVVLNPEWIDARDFGAYEVVEVVAGEPFGANLLGLAGYLLAPASAPRTAEKLARRGSDVRCYLDISEFEKAEGGLTCLSLRRG